MSEAKIAQQRGINGWLLVMVIYVGAIGPGGGFQSTQRGLTSAELHDTSLAANPVWHIIKNIYWGQWALLAALGLAAGALLLWRWKPSTPRLVMWLMFARTLVPLGFTYFTYAAWVRPEVPISFVREILYTATLYLVSAIGWTLYLWRSKRVKNTYG